MLSNDLAELYEVEAKGLVRAVKRNIDRFPKDFMFILEKDEFKNLKYHFDTSSWGGMRKPPYAFTEQGVAMLSSVLRSRRAIQVNIQIIRTFTKIRQMLASNQKLRLKVEEMERRYDKNFRIIFKMMRKMVAEEKKPKKIMGFTDKTDR